MGTNKLIVLPKTEVTKEKSKPLKTLTVLLQCVDFNISVEIYAKKFPEKCLQPDYHNPHTHKMALLEI